MFFPSRRPVRPPVLSSLVAGLVLLAASPAVAQGVGIDFGGTQGEGTLLGGGGPAVSGGPAPRETGRRGYGSSSRADEPARRIHSDRQVGGWRYGTRPSPSVAHVHLSPPSSYHRGTGIFANAQGRSGGSVVHYGTPSPESGVQGEAGPKIIDVASQRLDARPIGPGGISVHFVGSTKIIRLASGYGTGRAESAAEKDMAALPEPAGSAPPVPEPRGPAAAPAAPSAPLPAPRPVGDASRAAPAEEPVADDAAVQSSATDAAVDARTAAPSLEPWTEEWLADCVARHGSFDASLGTYVGEDGRRRFCTGEPA